MGEDDLSEVEQARLRVLQTMNAGVFTVDQSELGTTHFVTHTVIMADHPTIRQHPAGLPLHCVTK